MPIFHLSKSDTTIWDLISPKRLSEKPLNSSEKKNKNLMSCSKKMFVSKLLNISETTKLTSAVEKENGNVSLVKILLQLSTTIFTCLLSSIFQNSVTQFLYLNQVELLELKASPKSKNWYVLFFYSNHTNVSLLKYILKVIEISIIQIK